jgi:hypothetical protein
MVDKEVYNMFGMVDHTFNSGIYYRQCLVNRSGDHSIIELLQARLVGKLVIELLIVDALTVNKAAFYEFLRENGVGLHSFYNNLIEPTDPVTKAFGEFYKTVIVAGVH